MPRFSKHRGKGRYKNPAFPGSTLSGISHHKVCIVAAIDEHDNMLFKIGGLGRESFDILNQFRNHFSSDDLIISDDSHSIQTFVSENRFRSDIIPSNAQTTPCGRSVASVNEMHSELKNLIRRKHGISTRHLQGYLDWLVFLKHLRYTLEMRKWKPEAYMMTMKELIPFRCCDIPRQPMPINLYSAYSEYHYGVFKLIN